MNAGDEDADDRLPWLETVEDEARERPPYLRIALLILLALGLIAGAVAAWQWMQRGGMSEGNGALINAQAGDYKVKPDEPGGMKVEGEGDTVFAASEGATTNGSIDVSAVPETPVDGKAAPKPGPTPTTGKSRVVAPVPQAAPATPAVPAVTAAQRAPGPSAGSATIQLGSFRSEAEANAAWSRLSKRFDYLAPLGRSVAKAEVDGKSYYRLRVNAGSNGQARELCGKLKAAGEACFLATN